MNEFGGPTHRNKQIDLVLAGTGVADIDVLIANRITLETLRLRLLVTRFG